MHAARSGQWMEAAAIRRWGLESRPDISMIVLDLEGLEHLDASALQVLLAIGHEQRRHGRDLRLKNVSEGLRRWFDYAGADGLFRMDFHDKQPEPAMEGD